MNKRRHSKPKVRIFATAAVILLVAAIAACDTSENPTSTPQPTAAAPTETPGTAASPTSPWATAPATSSGASTTIPDWDLDETSNGQDLIDLLDPEEISCVEAKLGSGFQTFLRASLVDQGSEGSEDGLSSATECFTEKHQAAASVAMLNIAAGGLSVETRRCVSDVLVDNPTAGLFPSSDEDGGGPGMLQVMACLTPEEAAALTPPGEGPPPDTAGLACLMEEVEGTSSGERIIAVLSGADASGKGLTMEESAVLGQAVEACGIETDFGFPDPAETGASDDVTRPSDPGGVGGGSGQCTVGLILYPGDECSIGDFTMKIREDGAAVLDGNIGGISMGNTVMEAQSINLNRFSASRSGSTWTIESLP